MTEYATTRLAHSAKRQGVWKEICRYLNRQHISSDAAVLELGAGWGDFIGQIHARVKAAIEYDGAFRGSIESYPGVALHNDDALVALPAMVERSFDVVFASNYFEHFGMEVVEKQLGLIHRILKPGGKLIVIQPNFQLCAPKYFDDYTHKTVFSHISFSDLVQVHGFTVADCRKRFLPFSMKSRIPSAPFLVRLYLACPIKPMAGQFLLVAQRP